MGKYDILETANRLNASYTLIIKPPDVAPKPRNVRLRTLPIVNNNIVSYTLEITWDRPLKADNTIETFVTNYFIEFARSGDIYGSRQEVLENGNRVVRYENVGSGAFKARVASVMAINNKISLWEESLELVDFFPVNFNLDFTDPDSYGLEP